MADPRVSRLVWANAGVKIKRLPRVLPSNADLIPPSRFLLRLALPTRRRSMPTEAKGETDVVTSFVTQAVRLKNTDRRLV
jgi:hypothetical protein